MHGTVTFVSTIVVVIGCSSHHATDPDAIASDSASDSGHSDGVSGANYTKIKNDAPMPADFRPFRADSIWNRKLPDTPQRVDAANTARVQALAAISTTTFYTEGDNGVGGYGGYPVYLATATDPAVTVDCAVASQAYGCSADTTSGTIAEIPGTFHIPANARPGCIDQSQCGDMNLSVIQPDGSYLDIYGCNPTRDWADGDVIGGAICSNHVSGVAISHVVTGYGYNGGSVDGGDAFISLMGNYNEVVPAGAVMQHALEVRLPCSNGEIVFPGHSLYTCDGGIPSGSLIHLNLSHAEIDNLIAQHTYTSYMRPFLYAFHDYGAYFLDGGGSPGDGFYIQPRIESASPWLRNGGTNPWIPWFQAQNAKLGMTSGGVPAWYFDVDFYRPIAQHLEVLSSCYAEGTCTQ